MNESLIQAFWKNFLGNSPDWYKKTILAFLVINGVLAFVNPILAGWLLIGEFIFTLAMALKCHPLLPGGLLAIEAVATGLASTETVYKEAHHNMEVILLLIFMVAGIHFMQNMLLYVFTKLLINVRSKVALSLMFSLAAAFLSAFLDALTVTAVLIAVSIGFYTVYHKVASGKQVHHDDHDHGNDDHVIEYHREDLEQFRAFLRSLMMHGAVGTALGGVCTTVGEPQNLLVAGVAGWDFMTFFHTMAPVTMPVLFFGLFTCIVLELTGWFGYGAKIPEPVFNVLYEFDASREAKRTSREKAEIIVQGIVAILLVIGLATHVAAVGLIGLAVIILQTALNGVTDEHRLGHAFTEGLPFTALIVVFFAIVGVIHEQELFKPVIHWVLSLDRHIQPTVFFLANGALSAISDNVFVATVYINEVKAALDAGVIDRLHFDHLTVAINTGTNLPSVATPNGQAAFLFLLTSALAPLIRLSYGRMVWMALPYTIIMTSVGCLAVYEFLSS